MHHINFLPTDSATSVFISFGQETEQDLRLRFMSFRPLDRILLELSLNSGLSIRVIAALTNLNPGYVSRRLQLLRKKLFLMHSHI